MSLSTTMALNLTVHLSLVKLSSISPAEASRVQPSPSLASCPLGEILRSSLLHSFTVINEVVAPLSSVMFIGSDLENTVRTCELTGAILLSWQVLTLQLQ